MKLQRRVIITELVVLVMCYLAFAQSLILFNSLLESITGTVVLFAIGNTYLYFQIKEEG